MRIVASLANVVLRGSILHFRRAVPADLRPRLKRSELVRSRDCAFAGLPTICPLRGPVCGGARGTPSEDAASPSRAASVLTRTGWFTEVC